MLSADEIAEQKRLLATHRRTLHIYLHQQAEIGRSYSPPSVIHGIAEARLNIRRIKRHLREAGVDVSDHPDDDDSPSPDVPDAQPHTDARAAGRQGAPTYRRRWLIGGAISTGIVVLIGLLVAYSMTGNETQPVEISALCAVFHESPTDVKVDQPVILRWAWNTATDDYRQDYVDAASFSLQIDGQSVDISSASKTLSEEAGQFRVTWRLPPRTFSVGTHQVIHTTTLSRQVRDGYDSNNDGALDTFGPGVTTSPPCEIVVR